MEWRKRLIRAQRAAATDERFPLNSHADWKRVRERGMRDFLREVAFAQDGITPEHDADMYDGSGNLPGGVERYHPYQVSGLDPLNAALDSSSRGLIGGDAQGGWDPEGEGNGLVAS